MKNQKTNSIAMILGLMFLTINLPVKAQLLKNLKQRITERSEDVIIEKTSDKVAEKTDDLLDMVLNPKLKKNNVDEDNESQPGANADEVIYADGSSSFPQEQDFGVYSNFTFVPGSKLLFYDDFGKDAVGDFPAQWETGGSGEIVTTNQNEGHWLSLQRRSGYLPTTKDELPENYTIEFDLITSGYGTPNSASSKLFLAFLPKKAYSMGQAGSVADVELLFSKMFTVDNVENFGGEAEVRIANRIQRTLEKPSNNVTHISIAVNKKRLRVWFDQEKLVDSPNLLQGKLGKYFLIEARDILPEKKQFAGISNFRIAESTEDLRSQLIKNGKFSTTGIYFETGSSKVKKESYGILKDIALLLSENQDIELKIVGHTDSQGDDASNQQLSEDRAKSVKNILVAKFGLTAERFEPTGKGETEPVDDNSSETGRANNRRVEFIKL